MKKNTLIVCDPDSCYAEKLTDYLNEHSGGTIRAEVFTDPERLLTWLKDASADVLLISSAFLTEEYAKTVGADYYGKDARATVKIAEAIIRKDSV